MINLDSGEIEDLEERLIPVLRRRNIEVESINLIGLLGRGASSSVFSVLIDHQYHVLKLYYSHTSFLKEMRNRRRLIWPPKILLSSKQNENSLGYDLVITVVPEGVSFNSSHLLDWVQTRLAEHLIELHRLKRKKMVSVAALRKALEDVEYGSKKAAYDYGEGQYEVATNVIEAVKQYLKTSSSNLRVAGSLLHNDLWWDNIIIAKDDVYLVDWESMRVGDYAEDLAFMRVMLDFTPGYDSKRGFWKTSRDEVVANRFFANIIEMYEHAFEDETLNERLRFYMVLQSLRRLSDMSSGTYQYNRELVGIWLKQLPEFWEHGLIQPD